MARRNFGGGGGLGTLLLLGGGVYLASKLLGKKTGGGGAKGAATGWDMNDLCTQVELVDPQRAYQDAVQYAVALGAGRPKSKLEAEERLRAYFLSRFGQCEPATPPETFFDVNGNTYFWDGVVQYAWQEAAEDLDATITEPQGAQIPRVVGAIVGGPVVG